MSTRRAALAESYAKRSQPRRAGLTRVARASLLVSAFFALDKLLGMFRQVVIARQFGVSAELDAFNAANNIPDLLFALIAGGALAIALIPVLTETLELSGREAMWRLFSRVANWAFLITAGVAVIVYFAAEPIVQAEIGVAPGFTPQMQALVVDLMRLNLIATLLFSVSGLMMAGLQSNQHFLLPALAPVMYDVGQIFGALVLAPSEPVTFGPIALPAFGLGVNGLVYGVILGAGLHLLTQLPGLIHFRFRWSPVLDPVDSGLHKVARLMGPRILTIAAFNLVFVATDNLASRLEVGSVTALVYGWLIMQVPETLLATAIGTALLPTLSEQFARRESVQFEASLARANRALLALTLPITVILCLTLYPLVEVVFGLDHRKHPARGADRPGLPARISGTLVAGSHGARLLLTPERARTAGRGHDRAGQFRRPGAGAVPAARVGRDRARQQPGVHAAGRAAALDPTPFVPRRDAPRRPAAARRGGGGVGRRRGPAGDGPNPSLTCAGCHARPAGWRAGRAAADFPLRAQPGSSVASLTWEGSSSSVSSRGRFSADTCTPSGPAPPDGRLLLLRACGRSPPGRTACAPWHRPPPFVPREPAARRCETVGQVCSAGGDLLVT